MHHRYNFLIPIHKHEEQSPIPVKFIRNYTHIDFSDFTDSHVKIFEPSKKKTFVKKDCVPISTTLNIDKNIINPHSSDISQYISFLNIFYDSSMNLIISLILTTAYSYKINTLSHASDNFYSISFLPI